MTEPAQIWTEGDTIKLRLNDNHTLTYRANEIGLQMILQLLRTRERATVSSIGTKANPVQYDLREVEARLRLERRAKPPIAIDLRGLLKKRHVAR